MASTPRSRVIPANEYRRIRWRNGQGWTREIHVEGAAIYVCGSLDGMAPGVDAVLREVLGDERVETLLADGRYRRDVY